MPGELRRLSGDEVIAVFERFAFVQVHQRGSHVKLQRRTATGVQSLHIPRHRELKQGTLRAIYRQGARYVGDEQLRPYFFHD